MRERLKRMLIKEFLQIRRDPRMMAMILVMPIVQALVFGYAVTTDVRDVKLALLDRDNSVESRELASRFTGSGYFEVVVRVASDAEARAVIDSGDAKALLRIEPGFGAALRSGDEAPVQLILDGTDSNTAGLVLSYAGRIVAEMNRTVLARVADRTGRSIDTDPIPLRSRAWFNENLESRNFYVPGVVALIVTLVTLMLTSMAVVREKEIGTMEQIVVTPITSIEFILGKSLPFAIIAIVNVLVVTGIAVLWFRVPIRGSILLLLGATVVFLTSTIGIGLFISTASGTQQQAMMSAFFFYFPAVLLSGFMFPIANMPEPVQWLTFLNPLRYYLVIIRGIFLKGVGLEVLWIQMAALAALGTASLTLATRRFSKTLL